MLLSLLFLATLLTPYRTIVSEKVDLQVSDPNGAQLQNTRALIRCSSLLGYDEQEVMPDITGNITAPARWEKACLFRRAQAFALSFVPHVGRQSSTSEDIVLTLGEGYRIDVDASGLELRFAGDGGAASLKAFGYKQDQNVEVFLVEGLSKPNQQIVRVVPNARQEIAARQIRLIVARPAGK